MEQYHMQCEMKTNSNTYLFDLFKNGFDNRMISMRGRRVVNQY